MIPRPPKSPLFPCPTSFRSPVRHRDLGGAEQGHVEPAEPARGARRVLGGQVRRRREDRALHVLRCEVVRVPQRPRSEEHTSELQSQSNLVCRLLLEKNTSVTDPMLPSPCVPSGSVPSAAPAARPSRYPIAPSSWALPARRSTSPRLCEHPAGLTTSH